MSTEAWLLLAQLGLPAILFILAVLFIIFVYPHLSKDQQEEIKKAASMAIPAVEQTIGNSPGDMKRAAAIRMIYEILLHVGLKNPSRTIIDAALESAVWSMKQVEQRSIKPPAE